jgi:hypothetical protein
MKNRTEKESEMITARKIISGFAPNNLSSRTSRLIKII